MHSNDEEPFVKTGRVMEGTTPSEISGKPSDWVKNGAAVRRGETEDPKSEKDLDIPID